MNEDKGSHSSYYAPNGEPSAARRRLNKSAFDLHQKVTGNKQLSFALQTAITNPNDEEAFRGTLDVVRRAMKETPEYYGMRSHMFTIGADMNIDVGKTLISNAKQSIASIQQHRTVHLLGHIAELLVYETEANPYATEITYRFPPQVPETEVNQIYKAFRDQHVSLVWTETPTLVAEEWITIHKFTFSICPTQTSRKECTDHRHHTFHREDHRDPVIRDTPFFEQEPGWIGDMPQP